MFYDVYARLCSEKGISESKAAESIGLNRSAVAKWKKGALPGGQTIQKLADYFNVSVGQILEKEERPIQEDKPEIGYDDFTYAMHNETKDLPLEKKEMLLQMARFMKEAEQKEGRQ